MENVGKLFVRLFLVISPLFFFLATIVSLFGAGVTPFLTAPALARSKPFRRLRLRLRPKCVGSGGSGSGSGSGSASLQVKTFSMYSRLRKYTKRVLKNVAVNRHTINCLVVSRFKVFRLWPRLRLGHKLKI